MTKADIVTKISDRIGVEKIERNDPSLNQRARYLDFYHGKQNNNNEKV